MGLTVLDAGVLIAALDGDDAHHLVAIAELRKIRAAGDRLVLPASAYAEAMVGPSRRAPEAVASVDEFLDRLPATVEPASREIARVAASLRAGHGPALRLPDALVLATARVLRADLVLTTDARWPAVGIRVQIIGRSR